MQIQVPRRGFLLGCFFSIYRDGPRNTVKIPKLTPMVRWGTAPVNLKKKIQIIYLKLW